MAYVTVGEAAELLAINPRILTDAIYRGAVDARRCPLQRGRRMIPREYVAQIAAILRRRGVRISEPNHAA